MEREEKEKKGRRTKAWKLEYATIYYARYSTTGTWVHAPQQAVTRVVVQARSYKPFFSLLFLFLSRRSLDSVMSR